MWYKKGSMEITSSSCLSALSFLKPKECPFLISISVLLPSYPACPLCLSLFIHPYLVSSYFLCHLIQVTMASRRTLLINFPAPWYWMVSFCCGLPHLFCCCFIESYHIVQLSPIFPVLFHPLTLSLPQGIVALEELLFSNAIINCSRHSYPAVKPLSSR